MLIIEYSDTSKSLMLLQNYCNSWTLWCKRYCYHRKDQQERLVRVQHTYLTMNVDTESCGTNHVQGQFSKNSAWENKFFRNYNRSLPQA